MSDALTALERLRLTRDWTYTQLAAEIATATGVHRSEDCWRRLCVGRSRQPHARTVQALAQFLTAADHPTAPRRARAWWSTVASAARPRGAWWKP